MGVMDYFKSVPTMKAEAVRKFLADRQPDEYNLIDVRQPNEYEEDHIPGANLIPMAELNDRLSEIDPTKPTIAY
jgi:rhodanese-related sulfurtransferase